MQASQLRYRIKDSRYAVHGLIAQTMGDGDDGRVWLRIVDAESKALKRKIKNCSWALRLKPEALEAIA